MEPKQPKAKTEKEKQDELNEILKKMNILYPSKKRVKKKSKNSNKKMN